MKLAGGTKTEGVGFEPTDPFGSPVFKTGAINHSTTPPGGACRRAKRFHVPTRPSGLAAHGVKNHPSAVQESPDTPSECPEIASDVPGIPCESPEIPPEDPETPAAAPTTKISVAPDRFTAGLKLEKA